MLIKIPFTNLHIGTKSAIAQRRALSYGLWGNTFGDLASFLQKNRIDFKTLYNIYNNVVEVKMAIRKIQNAMAKAGLHFYYDTPDKKDANEDAQVKYFWEVIERYYTFSALKDLWVRDIEVAGNAFWHTEQNKGGQVVGINPVDPRTFYIVADKYGAPLHYTQRVDGVTGQDFEPNEIIHSIIDRSTRVPYLGVSPIESVIWDSRSEMASQLASYYFYENNMVPSHLLIVNEDLSAKQAKDLKEKMEEEYKGAQNKFKAGIIPFVKDIKTIAPSQKEMQFLETRVFNAKKIANAFGVDPFLLGYTEGVQRSNGAIIRKEFYENTVRSYELAFEGMLNRELLPKLGITGIVVEVKPSDYDDEKEVYDRTRNDVLAGIMTRNEARLTRGLKEHENELADDLMVNNLLLDDLALDMGEVRDEALTKVKENSKSVYDLISEKII